MADKNKVPAGVSAAAREDGTWSSDKEQQYDYCIRYLTEAIDGRTRLVEYAERAIRAYQGYPSRDKYLGRINHYIGSFVGEDNERAEKLREACKNIEARQNFTVLEAIDTMVAQAMGGVQQYECEPYDPYFVKDPEIIDKLKAAAKNAYLDNKVDKLIPQGIEFAGLAGSVYTFLEKKKNSDRVVDMTWIPATEMLLDPYRLKRNKERYIGHQTKASWNDLKKHLVKCEWTDQYMLRSINNVDEYLIQIEDMIQKLQGDWRQTMPAVAGQENLRNDIDLFYKDGALAWRDRDSHYSQSTGGSGEVDDDRYRADEVEVSYLYDLDNNIMFTIVNRRFIVEAQHNYMTSYLDYTYPVVDSYSGNVTQGVGSAKVHLDHPYVPLEFKRSLWMNYAYSPVVSLLDTFDDICALESLIYHTVSIMTPITFTGNPTDIEKLAQIAGVSGETIKGFIANSVTVLNKTVDLTPAITLLNRLESKIKWILHGPDAAEQASILGNRASGTEAALASGTVTQGLNWVLANVESWAAELAEKIFKFMVIYNGKSWEYTFPMDYSIATLSREELHGELRFRAVLKNRIKVEARQAAQTTMQWFVPLLQAEPTITGLYGKDKMARDVIPQIAENFTRQQIESWFEKSEDQKRTEEAQRDAMTAQAEAARAQTKAAQGIDMSYVNPNGAEGQFGTADVASALGGAAPTDEDWDPNDPEPYSGGRKPSPTSRKLQYGLTNTAEDLPIPALLPQEEPQPYVPPEMLDPEAEAALTSIPDSANARLHQTTEMGGIAANDPITGDNSIV